MIVEGSLVVDNSKREFETNVSSTVVRNKQNTRAEFVVLYTLLETG